jgi:hypothetical protein
MSQKGDERMVAQNDDDLMRFLGWTCIYLESCSKKRKMQQRTDLVPIRSRLG